MTGETESLAQAVNRDSLTGQQLPAGGGSSGLRKKALILGPINNLDLERTVKVE